MTIVNLTIPVDIENKVGLIADERGISIDALISELATSLVTEHDAHMRYLQRIELGKGREQDALSLLES
jgi:hypothetical protein